jgi:uncharacterized tellurite resistance protein B-like protein
MDNKIKNKLIELKKTGIDLDKITKNEKLELIQELNGFIKTILPPNYKDLIKVLQELENGDGTIRNIEDRMVNEIISYLQAYIKSMEDS